MGKQTEIDVYDKHISNSRYSVACHKLIEKAEILPICLLKVPTEGHSNAESASLVVHGQQISYISFPWTFVFFSKFL